MVVRVSLFYSFLFYFLSFIYSELPCLLLCYSISEDILRGCIEDIVGEVEQINNELVDSVYGAEFSVV